MNYKNTSDSSFSSNTKDKVKMKKEKKSSSITFDDKKQDLHIKGGVIEQNEVNLHEMETNTKLTKNDYLEEMD